MTRLVLAVWVAVLFGLAPAWGEIIFSSRGVCTHSPDTVCAPAPPGALITPNGTVCEPGYIVWQDGCLQPLPQQTSTGQTCSPGLMIQNDKCVRPPPGTELPYKNRYGFPLPKPLMSTHGLLCKAGEILVCGHPGLPVYTPPPPKVVAPECRVRQTIQQICSAPGAAGHQVNSCGVMYNCPNQLPQR